MLKSRIFLGNRSNDVQRMKILTLAMVFLFMGLSSIGQKTSHTPDYSVAIEFINSYIEYCEVGQSEQELIEWINTKETVTKKFTTELERILNEAVEKDPELGLGFDPIFDAQDYPNEFEIAEEDHEYLIVKGVNQPNFQLILRLSIEGDQWLIDGSGIVNIPREKRIQR